MKTKDLGRLRLMPRWQGKSAMQLCQARVNEAKQHIEGLVGARINLTVYLTSTEQEVIVARALEGAKGVYEIERKIRWLEIMQAHFNPLLSQVEAVIIALEQAKSKAGE